MKRLIRLDHVLLAAIVTALPAWPLAQVANAGPPELKVIRGENDDELLARRGAPFDAHPGLVGKVLREHPRGGEGGLR